MNYIRILSAFAAALALAIFLNSAPFGQSESRHFSVYAGDSVTGTAMRLVEAESLRSALVFRVAVALFGGEVRAGTYLIQRDSAVGLALRMARGITGVTALKVTLPEGSSTREMSLILEKSLPGFSREKFHQIARDKEGYLFPDTYYLLPGTPEDEIVNVLENNFTERTANIRAEALTKGVNFDDVVKLASILEKEARQTETRKVVAGILLKRLERGMPLQVDAVFGYIFERDTYSPSFEDLEVDSPYNTYRYKGLPPTAINNPGLDAMSAALNPTSSPYWFYLTGKDGTMHYARTFDEHVSNRRYLR